MIYGFAKMTTWFRDGLTFFKLFGQVSKTFYLVTVFLNWKIYIGILHSCFYSMKSDCNLLAIQTKLKENCVIPSPFLHFCCIHEWDKIFQHPKISTILRIVVNGFPILRKCFDNFPNIPEQPDTNTLPLTLYPCVINTIYVYPHSMLIE